MATIRPVSQAVRDATATAQESKLPVPPPVKYAQPGETVTLELPWSEVCMSMHVAGRTAQVRLEPCDDHGRCVAQIFDDNGRPFSFPVLPGEAGFYRNTDGWYYYPPVIHPTPPTAETLAEIRYRAAGELAAEFGTDIDEWLV